VLVTLVAVVALVAPRASASAQSLTGTVLRADGTTASGVIVLMLSERRDSVFARTTTGSDGRFLLRVARDRRVLLQLLRIGQRPQLEGPHAVSAATTTTVRIALADAPLQLAAVTVRDNAQCVVRPDSATTVAQLYEEARKALLSSSITTDARNMTARFVTFTRHEDLRGRQVTPIQRVSETRETSRPFSSVSADSLARIGYVYTVDDGTVYRAPDAEVLLSERFLNTHCLQLVNGTQDRADYVGVGFRPVGATKDRVEIRGTMWLDRSRTMLESVEFSYEPLAPDLSRARVGGMVEFARTPTNIWFVKRWELRMPRHSTRRVSAVAQSLIPGETTQRLLDGLDVTGGEVHTLSVGTQTLYSADPSVVVAIEEPVIPVADPAAAAPITTLMTPALCTGMADTTGSIVGRVVDQTNYGVGDVRVTATWKEQFRQAGDVFTWRTRTLTTASALGGGYALCGLPLATTISVDATPANTKSTAHQASLQLTPDARHLTRDLPVSIVVAQATFASDAQSVDDDPNDLPPRLKAFDKRASAKGSGSYVTREEIVKRRPGTVQQLLRNLGGIAISEVNGVRRAVSTRGRIMTGGTVKACELPIVIDNTEATGLDVLDGMRPSDVYGIEVYFGPASIPNEFMALANGAWCGMIGIWTIGG
jgi:hypothetical protein